MHAPPMVIALADAAAVADAGGKAQGLARLIAAGLPVPDGFVVTGAAFTAAMQAAGLVAADPAARGDVALATPARLPIGDVGHTLARWADAAADAPLPPALESDVLARARAIGAPLAVRSSLAIEDQADRSGAGLGLTLLEVPPDDVWAAIRAVWAAALTPLVAAYARGDSRPPAVIVQRFLPGTRGVIYTRPPGRPAADELWLDDGRHPLLRVPRGEPPPEVAAAAALALAAERAIAATAGADVEIVSLDPRARADLAPIAVVQARPIVHPPARPPRTPPPPALLALLRGRPGRWRRDATHNPDPLSPAQAGLCALIDEAGAAPYHLAVVAGHLYSAPREPAALPPELPVNAREFERRFSELGRRVLALVPPTGATVREVVDRYLAAYRILTCEITPLVAVSRQYLLDALAAAGLTPAQAAGYAIELAPRRPSSVAAVLGRAARGEIDRADLFSAVSGAALAWDVAVPMLGEQPAVLLAAVAAAAARPPPLPPAPVPPPLAGAVALARAAADAAERDDDLFASIQAWVRLALRAHARAHGVDPDDIFWIPLDDVVAGAPLDPQRTRARAAAARAAAARAASWEMPLSLDELPPAGGDHWQGVGVGGRIAGPAHRIDQLAAAQRVPRGAIVVTAAVTPALAVVLDGAGAIACEHGSILDHGAAIARELGIPCVVGCRGLTAAIADGDWLELDGDAGTITRRVR